MHWKKKRRWRECVCLEKDAREQYLGTQDSRNIVEVSLGRYLRY